MGQYFTLINRDREEYVSLPSSAKAGGRITDAKSMGMLGYLLLDGPMDGTGFSALIDAEEIETAIRAYIRDEERIEQKRFEEHLEDPPEYHVNPFEREHDTTPEESPELFEEYLREATKSAARDRETGEWDFDGLVTVVASHYEISELLDYAGRWAGDRVALVGDYAEGESAAWYDGTRMLTIAETPAGEEVVLRGTRELRNEDGSKPYSYPISTGEVPRATEPGDNLEISMVHHSGDERVIGEVVAIDEVPFKDITDGLTAEFESFVGDDWLDNQERSVMQPDMVVSN